MHKFVQKIWNSILLRFNYIDFATVTVESQPLHSEIPSKTVVIVGGMDWAKWAFMKCPCGCNEVLTLSLMKSYSPNWSIKVDKLNRITLTPSVWKKDGCYSHFFVKRGKLIWL